MQLNDSSVWCEKPETSSWIIARKLVPIFVAPVVKSLGYFHYLSFFRIMSYILIIFLPKTYSEYVIKKKNFKIITLLYPLKEIRFPSSAQFLWKSTWTDNNDIPRFQGVTSSSNFSYTPTSHLLATFMSNHGALLPLLGGSLVVGTKYLYFN